MWAVSLPILDEYEGVAKEEKGCKSNFNFYPCLHSLTPEKDYVVMLLTLTNAMNAN